MRAIRCTELAHPSALTFDEVDDPIAGAGHVVVDVAAAGVNFADALIVQGRYQMKIPPPFTPGMEVAGVVRSVGDGVTDLAVGDRVLALPALGGYAEQVAAPAASCVRLPDGISDAVAGSITQTYCTARFALAERVTVRPGDRVLVLGAGGGVGLACIDVAKAAGARVLAAASSPDKRALATAAGADEVIDTSDPDLDFKATVRELGGGGVDVVVDIVGGALAEPALRALDWLGTYLVIGFAAGEIPRIPLNLVLLNNRTVVGIDWGAWWARNPEGNRALLRSVVDDVAGGRLHPPPPTERPLAEAPQVLTEALARRLVGKVALVP